MSISNFQTLRKNVAKITDDFESIDVAFLADFSSQLLVQAIRGLGVEIKLNIKVFEADYDQIERQIFDKNSDLYKNDRKVVIVFNSVEKLWQKYCSLPISEREIFAKTELEQIANLCNAVLANLDAKVIISNYAELDFGIFGNYSSTVKSSFLYQTRLLNLFLMQYTNDESAVFLADISAIQNLCGRDVFHDTRFYASSTMPFSISILPLIAKRFVDIIRSMKGHVVKCVLCDLDNTLWGGVIGDDGIGRIELGDLGIGSVYQDIQRWLLLLKQRGIVLGVVSKNTEENAREPFEKHPSMILSWDDFSVISCNWESKADNIIQIQKTLNIGFDSIVFLDDNPVERDTVKTFVPDVIVPDLPEDPSEWLSYIAKLNLFETLSFSKEDTVRGENYRIEAKRNSLKFDFEDTSSYLKSLNMVANVLPVDEITTPRIAQLTQRTNQFNLRTKRYAESDIDKFRLSPNCEIFPFSLSDKFGDYGLVSVVILNLYTDYAVIDTFLMSCRVFNRGFECFVVNAIVDYLKAKGLNRLNCQYIPTQKNSIVSDLLPTLGFVCSDDIWTLNVDNFDYLATEVSKDVGTG